MEKYQKVANFVIIGILAFCLLNFALYYMKIPVPETSLTSIILLCYCSSSLIMQIGYYKTKTQKYYKTIIIGDIIIIALCLYWIIT